jgi:hypothetical protein
MGMASYVNNKEFLHQVTVFLALTPSRCSEIGSPEPPPFEDVAVMAGANQVSQSNM